MNKMIVASSLALLTCVSASADVIVALPAGSEGKEFKVEQILVSDMVKPRAERPESKSETFTVKNNAFVVPTSKEGTTLYQIPISEREAISFYTTPGDDLMVKVNYLSPLAYTVEGSPLMDAIYTLKPQEETFMAEYMDFAKAGNRESADSIINAYNTYFKDFVAQNPASPAVVYALLNLDGEDYLNAFNKLGNSIEGNALYPLAVYQKEYVEKAVAAEKKQEQLQSGQMDAPAFTLKNLDGKDVSLSEFRGKWVVLDFWGSWCGWCIKGLPALKEAYAQYNHDLEVIGIDCNEPEEAWRKAVAKYEIPWVNVYNPKDSSLLSDYGVQGFPTKVIISPQGKIANITVGEDPNFFNTLGILLNE